MCVCNGLTKMAVHLALEHLFFFCELQEICEVPGIPTPLVVGLQ